VTLLDSQTIIAVTPPHAAGEVTVTVTDGTNSATAPEKYRYVDSTNPRQVWEDPTANTDGTPSNTPSGRGPGGSGPSGNAGTAGTASTGPAPIPVPTHR
jgi:hypothetical protein